MNTFTPSVSVIVPVYNGAQTIEACLNSLLEQDYPKQAYEVIVVENGSTDNTTEIVKKYPVRLFHSKERGPAPARNMGIVNSQAEIVAFTDADCIAEPDWLSELIKPYADPEIGGVGGTIKAFEYSERNIVEQFSDECSPLINFISGEHEFLPHLYTANASYRRHLLLEVGGFNTHLLTAEDVDLAWRIQLEKNVKLYFAPNAVINHKHRTTRSALGRLYRHYGFGEILLDTMYGHYPGYPRQFSYQIGRIVEQILAMARYTGSILLGRVRLVAGWVTPYEAALPGLHLLIEWNNVRGKIDGLIATRLMKDVQSVLEIDRAQLIARLYGT